MLYTLADEVFADRIGYIREALEGRAFDYAIAAAPLDLYGDPFPVLSALLDCIAPGGQLAFKLRGDPETLLGFLRQRPPLSVRQANGGEFYLYAIEKPYS